jgi:5-methylcytosine-specific restriction protein B
LRRRFAFIDLEPQFNSRWSDWLEAKGRVERSLVDEIAGRMRRLNDAIAEDAALGPQFRVGHSYVTPAAGEPISNARDWFRAVVETEIGPLLEEYWFDRPERAREETERLLAGW